MAIIELSKQSVLGDFGPADWEEKQNELIWKAPRRPRWLCWLSDLTADREREETIDGNRAASRSKPWRRVKKDANVALSG